MPEIPKPAYMTALHLGQVTEILRANHLHGPGCPRLGYGIPTGEFFHFEPAPCNCWLSTEIGVWRDEQ